VHTAGAEPATRALRLGIPSKGRMAELTLELLNVR
jgi:ATP phosphoribosyltransferase